MTIELRRLSSKMNERKKSEVKMTTSLRQQKLCYQKVTENVDKLCVLQFFDDAFDAAMKSNSVKV